ncbi:nuclear transport factor 2 family protein [Pseudalkalibacillus sp. SCS-8]|uniref:nuclear transport factor 2 family protein n=1 Tax=Pseudalkalibacillus nanhaiensis TaxID=3115291 RepID=UPI0032DAAFEF
MDTIHKVMDDYFKCWNEGFKTKDGKKIREFLSEDFIGYWGHSDIQQPMVYDSFYDIESVLKQYDHAEKHFEPMSITERKSNEEYLVIGTEVNVINDVPHPAKCMFVWRKSEGDWHLQREFIELER